MSRPHAKRCLHRTLLPCVALLLGGCTSAYEHTDPNAAPGQRSGAPPLTNQVDVRTDGPSGWASMNALGQNGTTGGGKLAPTVVTTFDDFVAVAAGTTPAVIQLGAAITGKVKIGSNKTIMAASGVVFTGHLGLSGSANVILRDLTVVGYNCTDNPDCQSGADAVTIDDAAHHIWVDHCDISNGSDGNLDITHQADYVTVSWTKFHYTGQRLGGHQFSNLIGSSDEDTADAGHLKVTWHHDWWAEGVVERMPRARYGEIHVYNNVYTATGNSYCVGLGVNANMLLEDNVFTAVKTPVNTDFKNAASVLKSFGNLYEAGALASRDIGAEVFTPPYDYALQPADLVTDTVTANAGPSAK